MHLDVVGLGGEADDERSLRVRRYRGEDVDRALEVEVEDVGEVVVTVLNPSYPLVRFGWHDATLALIVALSLLCALPVDAVERSMLASDKEALLILAKALDLLKSMESEDDRERATVIMDGLAEMQRDWTKVKAVGAGKARGTAKKPGGPGKPGRPGTDVTGPGRRAILG